LPECLAKFRGDGFAIVDAGLDSAALLELGALLDTKHPGERNLLDLPAIRQLARSEAIRNLARPVLGNDCFAVRGILFNKTEEANWKVTGHQDCVIAVAARVGIPGWGPWSINAGVHHVRPASEVMSRMLAVRVHLDDCNADNGPLRVVPGTHKHGFLSDRQIQDWPKSRAVTCVASRGGAILMRPLLLHSSSPAIVPGSRRVVHLEFAAEELPKGVEFEGSRVRVQARPSKPYTLANFPIPFCVTSCGRE
jgi:ectoine hydroxylase-related dioxygenase (phytanoyl-CoA dioxygenase family)